MARSVLREKYNCSTGGRPAIAPTLLTFWKTHWFTVSVPRESLSSPGEESGSGKPPTVLLLTLSPPGKHSKHPEKPQEGPGCETFPEPPGFSFSHQSGTTWNSSLALWEHGRSLPAGDEPEVQTFGTDTP